jgi:membrane protease YdiL (CAAX protease family)
MESQRQWTFLQPAPDCQNNRETVIAGLACCLWFVAIILRRAELPDWTTFEMLFEASSFIVFAGIPIFFLATPSGEKWAQRVLLPRQGLVVQVTLCTVLGLFIGIGHALPLTPKHFPWLDTLKVLFFPQQFWLNSALFLGGIFIASRIPFAALALRQTLATEPNRTWRPMRSLAVLLVLHTLYLALRQGTALEGLVVGLTYGLVCWGIGRLGKGTPSAPIRLLPADGLLMVLCAGIIYSFSIPSFSFGVFIAVDLFILVLIYGLGLGRAHFGYSFQMRRSDGWGVLQMMVIAILLLVPLAVLSGFVQPERIGQQVSVSKLVSYFILFTFRVGIFEEVFFRTGLMVLWRDLLQSRTLPLSPERQVWFAAGGSSVLFGLAHIGNQSSGGSSLTTEAYAVTYIGLATLASLCYALAFARSNRLAPPILVHGFVDTTAVLLLGGFLSVPF